MTFVILKGVDALFGLRRDTRDQGIGMDIVQHGEEAYNRGEGAVLLIDRRARGGERKPDSETRT
jgi:ammonium transporter, Amt family